MKDNQEYFHFREDITENRHKGSPESIAANKRVNKVKDRAKVFELIGKLGYSYSKQIARLMDKPLNSISGRFSELKRDGMIEPTGDRNEGCAVYQLKKFT